jgi:filamentous hemagglutinin
VFQKVFNYNKDNYNHLLNQLQKKALHAEAVFHSKDNYGSRYTVDIPIEGYNQKKGNVRTGWLIPNNSKQARLATIYVLKEKK